MLNNYAALAQLVERFHGKEEVVGSSPTGGLKKRTIGNTASRVLPIVLFYTFKGYRFNQRIILLELEFINSSTSIALN